MLKKHPLLNGHCFWGKALFRVPARGDKGGGYAVTDFSFAGGDINVWGYMLVFAGREKQVKIRV